MRTENGNHTLKLILNISGGLLLVGFLVVGACFVPLGRSVEKHTKEHPSYEPLPLGRESIADIEDHGEKYKGKVFKLEMILDSKILAPRTLRDFVGKTVQFCVLDEYFNLHTIMIDIPLGMDVPLAQYNHDLLVEFECTKGSTNEGNIAKSIQRPRFM